MVRNKNEPQKGLNNKVDTTSTNGYQGKSSSVKYERGTSLSEESTSDSIVTCSINKDLNQGSFLNSGSFLKIGPKMSAKDLINTNKVINGSSPSKNGISSSSGYMPQTNGFNRDYFERQVNCNRDTGNKELINNHVSSILQMNNKKDAKEGTSVPSQGLNQSQQVSRWKSQAYIYKRMFGVYKEGQNVLTRWSDGLYYLGKICKVCIINALNFFLTFSILLIFSFTDLFLAGRKAP